MGNKEGTENRKEWKGGRERVRGRLLILVGIGNVQLPNSFFTFLYLISSSFFLISMLNKMIENKRMNNSDPIFS
jgi:hypothetical protein